MSSKPKILSIIIISLLFYTDYSIARDIEREQRAAKYNQSGIEALNKNDYIQAIDFFNQALQILPKNITVKKNLAITYNNYAITLNGENNTEDAKEYLYKAIELEKDNIHYKENLANIISSLAEKYYKDGEYDIAIRQLTESLALLPKHIPSLLLLGQIHYQMQELEKAQNVWERAYKYDPHNSELKQMLSRLKNEKLIETDLKQLDAYYFDIRFDKTVIDEEIYDVRYDLRDAYRDVGRDFNYYPQHKIPVILYAQEDFQKLRQTPDWVSGIYDGKIRLPIKNNGFSITELKKIIWHEYTHAVVFDLTDGRCPTWLNEGLAKYEELKQEKPDLTILKKAINENYCVPINKLESSFSLKNDPEKLNIAYLEAYSFIDFILNRWSFYLIKDILSHLKQGKSLEEAFYEETGRSMNKLNKDWCDYVQERY